ncbi:MAG: STAS domain-containing protein, partial [Phenylobacterium sp.]
MDLEAGRTEGRLIARPKGRVDETNWEAFSEALIGAVRQARETAATLIVDLSGLDYMSSRGLRALTMAKREAGDDVGVVLAAPNARMREILAISRYDLLFQV